MPVRYQVRHETIYRYPEAVPHAQTEARIQPRATDWQQPLQDTVEIHPRSDDRRSRTDYFGNRVLYYSIQEPHTESSVVSEFEVELHPEQRPNPLASSSRWEDVVMSKGMREWTYPSPVVPHVPAIEAYARSQFIKQPLLLRACGDLMERIFTEFNYDGEATVVDTPLQDAFDQRAGVCQDFAHIMLCGLRGIGIPCRYVSGYLETFPPPGETKLVGSDASHAWISVFDPDLGWVDFDPTNNLLPHDQHLTLAWGRDFTDVIPVKGVVIGGAGQKIEVLVDVKKSDSGPPL